MKDNLQKKDFFKTIRQRDLEGLNFLLEKYPDLINKKTQKGYTALEVAFYSLGQNDSIMKTLIEHGASLNESSGHLKQHLAFILVRRNKTELVELMIQHGLNKYIKDSSGYSLLDIAFFYECNKTIEMLKKYIKVNDDLFILLDKGENTLFKEKFNELKKQNPEWDIKETKGKVSLLEKALFLENYEITEFLLKKPQINPNIVRTYKGSEYNLSNRLVLQGNEKFLELFLKRKFNPNKIHSTNRNTLYYAISQQNIKAIEILLQYNCSISCVVQYKNQSNRVTNENINKSYETGNLPLIELIYKEFEKQIQEGISFKTDEITSPHFYFFKQGNTKAFEHLKETLPQFFNPLEKDNYGNNYLHLALKNGKTSYIKELLVSHPEFQYEINKGGLTPLDMILGCSKISSSRNNIISTFVNFGGVLNYEDFPIYQQNLSAIIQEHKSSTNAQPKLPFSMDMSFLDKVSLIGEHDIYIYLKKEYPQVRMKVFTPEEISIFLTLYNYKTKVDYNGIRLITSSYTYYKNKTPSVLKSRKKHLEQMMKLKSHILFNELPKIDFQITNISKVLGDIIHDISYDYYHKLEDEINIYKRQNIKYNFMQFLEKFDPIYKVEIETKILNDIRLSEQSSNEEEFSIPSTPKRKRL